MMRNFIILITLLSSIPFLSFSQNGKVQGLVVDGNTKQPIVGASVTVVTAQSKAFIRGDQSGEDGKFSIEKLSASGYALKVTNLGYDDYMSEVFTLKSGQTLNMDTILLLEVNNVISEVTVQGATPALRIDIDKKVFDASQSLISAGGNAQDLLSNVPTLQVDQDGALSLRGSSNVKVLIDGKESAMAGSDMASLLQSLPADAIDKVEIITNPSAKYDAEGQSGIVNIVLKKNARLGFNGSVNANYGSFNNASAGVDLNYRGGRFNLYSGYNFNHRVSLGDGYTDNRQFVDGVLNDDSPRTLSEQESKRIGDSHTIRFGTDFYASEKATLSLISNLSLRGNDRRQDMDFQYWNIPELGNSSFRRSQQYEDDLGLDLQFDYQQKLKREGETLSTNVSYGYDTEDGINDFTQTYDRGDIKDFLRRNNTTETGTNWNFQLDYVLPLGENHKFEAGYRSILRNAFDTQFSNVDTTGAFVPDYNVSNNFDLSSSVHAAYINYQRQLTERIGAQIGLRAEQAYLDATLIDVNPSTPDSERRTNATQDYFRLYPSVFFTYALNDQDKIQLNYSRRVQRPNGWQVNPFINMSNETNYRQGNPALMPEDIHAFELGYAKFFEKWNFVTSAFYRRVNDMTMPYTYDASEIEDIAGGRSNVTFSRWENIGRVDAGGIEIVSKVNMTSWWDAVLNLNGFYSMITPYSRYDNSDVSTPMGNANLTTNLKFGNNFTAQVRGDYRSGMKTLQGRMLPMYGADLALKKELLSRRASLMLNVRDVFNTRRFRMENRFGNSQMNFSNRFMRRMVSLTFTYRFGFQGLRADEKKETAPESGMGDMGGGEF